MDQEHSQLIVPSTDDVARINGRRRLLKGLAAGAAGLGALSMATSASAYTAANDAVDVSGGADGYGLHAGGGLAALRLKPASAGTGAPTNNSAHQNGELFVDSNGDLYYSVGPAAGGANTRWRKLAGANPSETDPGVAGGHSQPGSLFFMPFSARIAARDVVNSGAPQLGTFNLNAFSTIQATGIAALNGGQIIPTGAKGILGTVVAANSSTSGRVKVFPSSVSNQGLGTASIAYSSAAPNVFGFFATTLDSAGAFKAYVFDSFPGVLALDVFAYFY